MKVEQIKAHLNQEYVKSFCKKVGVLMRRLNISCSIQDRTVPGDLNFNKINFKLLYVGYAYTMVMDEAGTAFTLLDKAGNKITTTDDLKKIKEVVVKHIRTAEAQKKISAANKKEQIKPRADDDFEDDDEAILSGIV